MSLFYRIAADLVLALHVGYVLFVVAGFVLTLAGIVRHWNWIRNPWFRGLHLACILIVVAEAWLSITCPLTKWEKALRRAAGESAYRGDFLANALHEALFFELPPWAFTLIYTAFGALVLATFVLAPPRRNRPRNTPPPA